MAGWQIKTHWKSSHPSFIVLASKKCFRHLAPFPLDLARFPINDAFNRYQVDVSAYGARFYLVFVFIDVVASVGQHSTHVHAPRDLTRRDGCDSVPYSSCVGFAGMGSWHESAKCSTKELGTYERHGADTILRCTWRVHERDPHGKAHGKTRINRVKHHY